ncbi:hypothetical protein MRX96_010649 [Rhipicephalus microplus]
MLKYHACRFFSAQSFPLTSKRLDDWVTQSRYHGNAGLKTHAHQNFRRLEPDNARCRPVGEKSRVWALQLEPKALNRLHHYFNLPVSLRIPRAHIDVTKGTIIGEFL